MFIYLYEHSTCRYVRLNTLNVRHVHGPRFNAPKWSNEKVGKNPKKDSGSIGFSTIRILSIVVLSEICKQWSVLPDFGYFSCKIVNFFFFFFTFGPNRTQVCSHIIGYIPVPIGILFAIAPTHICLLGFHNCCDKDLLAFSEIWLFFLQTFWQHWQWHLTWVQL